VSSAEKDIFVTTSFHFRFNVSIVNASSQVLS
jgi:hypothetical protein